MKQVKGFAIKPSKHVPPTWASNPSLSWIFRAFADSHLPLPTLSCVFNCLNFPPSALQVFNREKCTAKAQPLPEPWILSTATLSPPAPPPHPPQVGQGLVFTLSFYIPIPFTPKPSALASAPARLALGSDVSLLVCWLEPVPDLISVPYSRQGPVLRSLESSLQRQFLEYQEYICIFIPPQKKAYGPWPVWLIGWSSIP